MLQPRFHELPPLRHRDEGRRGIDSVKLWLPPRWFRTLYGKPACSLGCRRLGERLQCLQMINISLLELHGLVRRRGRIHPIGPFPSQ